MQTATAKFPNSTAEAKVTFNVLQMLESKMTGVPLKCEIICTEENQTDKQRETNVHIFAEHDIDIQYGPDKITIFPMGEMLFDIKVQQDAKVNTDGGK